MAKNRYINTHFWDDNYIINLDPIEKLLFLYFLTNTRTSICGIYEITLKRIAFDTGIDRDMVLKILARFEKDNKIKYDNNGFVAIKNFIKHQKVSDKPEDKINIGIAKELEKVPIDLIKWIISPLKGHIRGENSETSPLNYINLNINLKRNLNINTNEEKKEKSPPSYKNNLPKKEKDLLCTNCYNIRKHVHTKKGYKCTVCETIHRSKLNV